jgi:hypothetical protein
MAITSEVFVWETLVQDTERKWMVNQEIVKALGTSGSFTRVGTPMPRAQRNDVSYPNQKKAS